MKYLVILFLLLASTAITNSQTVSPIYEKLPASMVPSKEAKELERSQGAKAIVLLPRGMFPDVSGSDTDNPIGIRGGGAYYSFSTGLYSYNRTPQISSDQGKFSVGFYGLNFGMIADLGVRQLGSVSTVSAEVITLKEYAAPTLESDIRLEQDKSTFRYGAASFARSVPIVNGSTYLLRAICYHEGVDLIVAFTVVDKREDGSVELIWKKILDLHEPYYVRVNESELATNVQSVLKDPRFSRVQGTVVKNTVTLTGTVAKQDLVFLIQKIAQLGATKLVNAVNVD